jgi:predicted nucleic acid-binding protein
MGLNASRVYLDACIVIYLVEEHPVFGKPSFDALLANVGNQFCISPLVELECLVLPLRNENDGLIARYESFFRKYRSLELTPEVYRTATELRARQRLKTLDALHLATAKHHGCGELWTNDDRFGGTDGVAAVNILAGIRTA